MTIARASRLPAADPGSAASALRSRGVVLPALPPSKSLTEGDVVAIGRSLGLDLRTSRPEASFGEPEVTRFLRAFGGALRGNGDDPPGVRSDNDPPGPYPRPEGAADPL